MQRDSTISPKQLVFALLKVAVSIGLLALVLRNLDMAAVAAVLGRLPATAIAAGLLLMLAQVAVLGLRWWLVMAAIEAPIGLGSWHRPMRCRCCRC